MIIIINNYISSWLHYRETPRDQGGLKKSGPLRPGQSEKESTLRDWLTFQLPSLSEQQFGKQQFCGRYLSGPEREIAKPTILYIKHTFKSIHKTFNL